MFNLARTVMKTNAIVLTHGMLHTNSAKTAHGLIRGSERFTVKAIIDHQHAGKDAGELVDGKPRQIPIYSSIEGALNNIPDTIEHCIIGLAFAGGKIPLEIQETLKEAIRLKMSIVNGLHEFLSNNQEFVTLAEAHRVQLIDIRKPKKIEEMQYWSGRIYSVQAPRIAVLGTDCSLGKRTTARFLMEACRKEGLSAEMIYTGQTGWMQGSKYGFIFDSTINDFVAGELESAIVQCAEEAKPDVMFLEGQSSLRNPLGPCGAEYLLSGAARYVVLQHSPYRRCFKGTDVEMPSLASELQLIQFYGAEVLALTLNTSHLSLEEAQMYQRQYGEEFGIPVVLPIEGGVSKVVDIIRQNVLKNI